MDSFRRMHPPAPYWSARTALARVLVLALVWVGLLARVAPAPVPVDARALFGAAVCHDDAGAPQAPERHDVCPLCPICQPPGSLALDVPVPPEAPRPAGAWQRVAFAPVLARAPPARVVAAYLARGPPVLG